MAVNPSSSFRPRKKSLHGLPSSVTWDRGSPGDHVHTGVVICKQQWISHPPLSALGKPLYLHIGEEIDGVDMRAEVGLLSRNIVVMGEMEDRCYPYNNHVCNFFDFDTFGGHIKVWVRPTGSIPALPAWQGPWLGRTREQEVGPRAGTSWKADPCCPVCCSGCRPLAGRQEGATLGTAVHSPVTCHPGLPACTASSPRPCSHSLSPTPHPGRFPEELAFHPHKSRLQ